jgi:hypothetical protein
MPRPAPVMTTRLSAKVDMWEMVTGYFELGKWEVADIAGDLLLRGIVEGARIPV